jgi:outer membrane protein assembly factor BamC
VPENSNVTRPLAIAPVRLSLIALAAASLVGCSWLGELVSGDKVDYRTQTAKSKPLDVPPDLTQLSRDSRYGQQGGVISAAATPSQAPAVATGPTVAPQAIGDVRVERDGTQRWLVVPMTPEQLYPQVKAFWQERGFTIATDSPESGVIETDWAENRAKLPNDVIRNTIGRVLGNLYDTGERDRFRTRIERTATGSEVYISHRGLEEVYTGDRKESTVWRPRAGDPQLEAEFLSRLMAKIGVKEETAKTLVANAAPPQTPARARAVSGGANTATLEVDEPFDRAWRRVGLALDRGGFTVEDRDRTGGLYYVRYIDPKNADKEEPGFFSRLFGSKDTQRGPLRYRISVKGSGDKTLVSVLTSAGNADVGENGQRIVGQLINELR